MDEGLVFDCFEQLAAVPDEQPAERKKPSEGPHTFTVKKASFFEDSTKLSLLLEAEDGTSIFKKLYLGDPTKAYANKSWMRAMLTEKPKGRLIDYKWESLEGTVLQATVGSFTPQDRDEQIVYVAKPERCDQPKSSAKKTVDQKAKAQMSAAAADDIPF